jgi:uncharacterized protein with von Willebrand factor type A (vWA) domain
MSGRLADNITYFARALREAGMILGPGVVLDAIEAVKVGKVTKKADFYWVLHSVFVKKHEDSLLFQQAFSIFWRRRAFIDKLIATMSPRAPGKPEDPDRKPDAGALRVAEALMPKAKDQDQPLEEKKELSARLTMSDKEILQARDFAQMTAAEIAQAKQLISRMVLPDDTVRSRRFVPVNAGGVIDLRRSLRQSMRAGGAGIELAFRDHSERHPPIVALCDISGSMADYAPLFLHFLHALTDKRRRVETFLFGTRLTNVTRSLRKRDPDEALALCGAQVEDWSGGTRIGTSLYRFNRDWSRRVLGQGAVVLLFTDGLERDDLKTLEAEMARLHRSCRRLVWINPLLRFGGFEAKAQGIRTMLPLVDDFRPIHSLAAMADLVKALSKQPGREHDPKLWLKRAG